MKISSENIIASLASDFKHALILPLGYIMKLLCERVFCFCFCNENHIEDV